MKFDSERTGTGTREWAEVTENIQLGCVNDCLYCYAANNANRFRRRDRAEWAREELTRRANMRSYPAKEGVVMFPSAHDITQFNVEAFIKVAKLILAKGNKLLIVTKPRLDIMLRVMEELSPWRDQILLRFTIGSMDAGLTALWEPGAPSPSERLFCLRVAGHRGFAFSVSIEPMLGGVEETLRVVRMCMPFEPESVWIGKMNKIRVRVADKRQEVLEAIRRVEELQRDEEILRLVDSLKGNPAIRWKDSIKVVLENNKSGGNRA